MHTGLADVLHFGRHSTDTRRVFLGWEQQGQVEKAAGHVPKSRTLLMSNGGGSGAENARC